MRRLLSAALIVLLIAACGTEPEVEETAPTPTPTPTPEDTPTPEPTPTPTPTPEPEAFAPLTGMPVEEDPTVLERPVVAVKVDNLQPARPQAGIDEADLVMVQLVEGATRFIAFFHSDDPGVVGPVRSGRLAEADLLPPFSPVYAMSGAHGPVGQEIRAALDVVYEEGQAGGWFRDNSRPAPHNLFVTATDLWEAAPDLPAPEPFWVFDDDTPAAGTEVGSFVASYPRSGDSGWEWDAGAERWLRNQNGAPHTTIDGDRIAADNVAVVRMDATGYERRPFEPIGEGEATVFRDGQEFEARWEKPTRDAHIELFTPDGEPFPMQRGQTWIELLPTTGTLSLTEAGS